MGFESLERIEMNEPENGEREGEMKVIHLDNNLINANANYLDRRRAMLCRELSRRADLALAETSVAELRDGRHQRVNMRFIIEIPVPMSVDPTGINGIDEKGLVACFHAFYGADAVSRPAPLRTPISPVVSRVTTLENGKGVFAWFGL